MNRDPRLDAYLDATTAHLDGDEELRRDIRAELAAHLDDAADAFRAAGHAPDESAELALQSFGPATDYAGELVSANRRRMRLRGRVRLLMRALVVPAALMAVVVSLSDSFLGPVRMLQASHDFGMGFCSEPPAWLRNFWRRPFTPDQRLVLYGDPARKDPAGRQRALWERWPTNVVYLNHYLSSLHTRFSDLGATLEERSAVFDRELDAAIAADPRNARYHYMRAERWLALGGSVETIDLGKNDRGESMSDYRLAVTNRAAIDGAMVELLAGLGKPALRRYASDMLAEQLAIMGPPRSLARQVEEVGIAAGVLLPDLSAYRQLTRASLGYARLLIAEGRPEAARPYIDAWRTLTLQLTEDSFTLIDVLLAAGIAGMGQKNATAIYQELGDRVSEERTRTNAAALSAPVAAFRARVKAAGENEDETRRLRRQASILSAMLLPALGETVPTEDLTAGRMVEYVILDRAVCALAGLLLVIAMLGALLVALRWRFIRGGGAAPLLLIPNARQTVRILAYGVLIPLLLYFAWTRVPLTGGRGFALAMTWPATATQAALLVMAVVIGTGALSVKAIRDRCRTLGVEIPPTGRGRWLLIALAVTGVLLLACAQALRLAPLDETVSGVPHSALLYALAILAVALALVFLAVVFRGLFGSSRFGLYRGTVARSLIPYLGVAVVLITVLANPYLRGSEARLVATDTLLSMPASGMAAGFTRVEARLVERLRKEMLEAAGVPSVSPGVSIRRVDH